MVYAPCPPGSYAEAVIHTFCDPTSGALTAPSGHLEDQAYTADDPQTYMYRKHTYTQTKSLKEEKTM